MQTLTGQKTRILIVDDHAVMCAGLRMLLERQPEFEVVGEALTREEALEVAAREQPDVVLLDLDLAGENGLYLLPDLVAASGESTRILILTGVRDPEVHRKAYTAGAVGVVMKDQASEVLLRAIAQICAGEVWIERSMMASVLRSATKTTPPLFDPEQTKLSSLTDRERDVIALICQGLKNQQIAGRLFITSGTVRNHLNSIFHKLEVADRLALAVYAYEHGLGQMHR